MRDMMRDQLPLMQGFIEHVHAEELAVMSEALDHSSNALGLIERGPSERQGWDPRTARDDGGAGRACACGQAVERVQLR